MCPILLSLARWGLHECTQATTPTLPLRRSWLLPACPRLLLRSRPVSVCVPAARPRLRDARSDGKQAPRWRRRRQARRRSRACWSRQSPMQRVHACMHTPPARDLMAAVSGLRVYSFVAPGRAFNPNSLPRFLPFDWPRSRPRQRQMAWRDHSRAGVGHS